MRRLLLFLVLILFISSFFILSSASAVELKIQIGGGDQERPGGPPAHAPARGLRAKQAYQYYPSANVYFDPVKKVYFYLSGGVWKFGLSLPLSLKVKLGDHVSLELDTDKPYLFNAEHKRKYPPGQLKKGGPPGKKGGRGKKKKK